MVRCTHPCLFPTSLHSLCTRSAPILKLKHNGHCNQCMYHSAIPRHLRRRQRSLRGWTKRVFGERAHGNIRSLTPSEVASYDIQVCLSFLPNTHSHTELRLRTTDLLWTWPWQLATDPSMDPETASPSPNVSWSPFRSSARSDSLT